MSSDFVQMKDEPLMSSRDIESATMAGSASSRRNVIPAHYAGAVSAREVEEFRKVSSIGTYMERGPTTPKMKGLRNRVLMRAVFAEFLATFLFLYICCATLLNFKRQEGTAARSDGMIQLVGICLSTFLTATALIYTFADISGAHFNPAITLATYVARKTSNRKFLLYIAAQIAGGIASQLLILATFPDPLDNIKLLSVQPAPGVHPMSALVMELCLTFCLTFIVFTVAFATIEDQAPNVEVLQAEEGEGEREKAYASKNLTLYTTSPQSKAGFAPLAIGFTVGLLTMVGGSISGGAFNPARVISPAIFGASWENQWLYWVGDLLGAILAALASQVLERSKPAFTSFAAAQLRSRAQSVAAN